MIVHILKASLERSLRIRIIYQKENNITERDIKVYEICQDEVKAYCYLRRQIRIFKKDKILSAAFINKYAKVI